MISCPIYIAELSPPHLRGPLVNVNQLPNELVLRIFQLNAPTSSTAAHLPTWEVAAAAAGWVIAGLGVLAVRYVEEGRR